MLMRALGFGRYGRDSLGYRAALMGSETGIHQLMALDWSPDYGALVRPAPQSGRGATPRAEDARGEAQGHGGARVEPPFASPPGAPVHCGAVHGSPATNTTWRAMRAEDSNDERGRGDQLAAHPPGRAHPGRDVAHCLERDRVGMLKDTFRSGTFIDDHSLVDVALTRARHDLPRRASNRLECVAPRPAGRRRRMSGVIQLDVAAQYRHGAG